MVKSGSKGLNSVPFPACAVHFPIACFTALRGVWHDLAAHAVRTTTARKIEKYPALETHDVGGGRVLEFFGTADLQVPVAGDRVFRLASR